MRKRFLQGVAVMMSVVMLPLGIWSTNGNVVAAESKSDDIQWELVWSDEFEGDSLDETKWSYRLGSAYNDEQQYYKKENVSVSDGTLKITAKKESVEGYPYTSGRISTGGNGQDLFATKYGRIEARIKLPDGTGMWPAFWMMPKDSVYGNWPLSGEIDIMEARGRLVNEVNGTIHFGESGNNKRSLGNTYTFTDGTDITDYHIYAVEWSENEIVWYVDDVEYYRTSNWYTMDDEGAIAEYPAPFNQEFYIILNLAVGGNYDSYRTPSDDELPAVMEVDYVRVYHDAAGYSDTNITMPDGARDDEAMSSIPVYEDGNLLSDIEFEDINTDIEISKYVDLSDHKWHFTTNKYALGDAILSRENINGSTFVNVDITDPGSTAYSVQLTQLLPLAEGYVYKVSFEAKCPDGDKTIKVKAYGEENYCNSYKANLTTELQKYEFSFMMQYSSDLNAHLQINIGQYDGDVVIGNVKVQVVDTYNEAEQIIEESTSEIAAEPETEAEIENTEETTEAEINTKPQTEEETTVQVEENTEEETTTEQEEDQQEINTNTDVKLSLKEMLGFLNRWWRN